MGDWIDFKELRGKLRFEDIFEKYGIRLHVRGTQAVGPCPLPNHSGSRHGQSFSASLEKGIFQCFSCKAQGNILDFAVLMDGRNPENGEELRETALSLAKHFNITFNAPNPEPKPPARDEVVVNAPLDFELKDLDSTHEYLRSRKLTPETIQHFGLGFCSRGYFKNRVVIPIHTKANVLVGYAGRVVDDRLITKENPKYLVPGTRKRDGVMHEFRKSHLVYNAHRLEAPLENVIVVEGFASVWWITQNGIPNCVSVMGSSISEEQVEIVLSLLSPAGQVILVPDGDPAGGKLREEATALFEGRAHLRCIELRKGVQPTGLSPEELAELLSPSEETAGMGGVSPREDICALVKSFPCLARFNITPETWDAEGFDRRALKFSSGELSIAQFVLSIWNPRIAWQCGKFDFIEAAARLDDEHRHVIIEWFKKPWWP